MIVDPSTGLPIGNEVPVAGNTIAGQLSMDFASGLGYGREDVPLFYDVASSIPSAAATMGWNVSRAQRTIFDGGRPGAQNARGIRQTFSPKSWGRLARPANIDPTNSGLGNAYTPFNFLSTVGNKSVSRVSKMKIASGNTAIQMAAGANGSQAFSPGTIGRVASVGKMNAMSGAALNDTAPNIYKAIQEMNPNYYAGSFRPTMNRALAFEAGSSKTTGIIRGGMTSTVTGNVSGRVAGFIGALETPVAGGARAGFMSALPEGSAARAGAQAASKFGATKAGAFLGQKAILSGAARAAGPVGWVLLAHDLAKMSGKMVGTGINTMIDAGRSFKGSIDKPAFGMGFTDNSVAATSRQRGVMAISNSRLNMRSMLGSEAAFIHARMG